jgi:hypothetical protein
MRWVTADRQTKKLLIREKADDTAASPWRPSAGFEDAITRRAIHELLFQPSPCGTFPFFPALVAARSAVTKSEDAPRMLVWVDPAGTFYPPAAAALGVSADQICVLRPRAADFAALTQDRRRAGWGGKMGKRDCVIFFRMLHPVAF